MHSSRPRGAAISKALLAVLDPDVVFRADQAAVRLGSLAEIRGAPAVAGTFKGRAQAARPALVGRNDGGCRHLRRTASRRAAACHLRATGFQRVEAMADAERIGGIEVELLER